MNNSDYPETKALLVRACTNDIDPGPHACATELLVPIVNNIVEPPHLFCRCGSPLWTEWRRAA